MFILLFFCSQFKVFSQTVKTVGNVNTTTKAISMTMDTEYAKNILQHLLGKDGVVTNSEIVPVSFKTETVYFLSGKVQKNSKNVNRISYELGNEDGILKIGNGVKVKITCEGDPCNDCGLKGTGWPWNRRYHCECAEADCNDCRCNQTTETEVEVGLF